MFRVKDFSWWEQELPSEEEMENGRKNLEKVNYKVDYVLTHCLPQSVLIILLHKYYTNPESDRLTTYFQELINEGLEFTKWYCGHYHLEEAVMCNYEVLYENIRRIL